MRSTADPSARAYGAVLAAAVACYAALGAVLAILPRYVGSTLHEGSVAVGLAVGAPAITGVLARPLGGRLADRLGPARVLLAGAGIMAAGGALVVPLDALGALLASRLIAGAGEGLMMSAAVLWLLRLAGPQRRGRALGHVGLANYAGLALGALLAAALHGAAGARVVFAAAVALPALGALVAAGAARAHGAAREAHQAAPREGSLLGATLRPGIGLLLVNVGYVAVLSFGARAVAHNGTGPATLIVPAYAATVVAVRTLGASIPDRLGARRTLALAVPAEAIGLAAVAVATFAGGVLAGVVVLAAGQALAVPALGMLALAGVPRHRHGEAAGLFFAWFDAGVGLGGPAVGGAAAALGPGGALVAAALAVTLAVPAGLSARPAGRAAQGRFGAGSSLPRSSGGSGPSPS